MFSYHANIKDSQFDVEWFSSFTLVVNALDNIGGASYDGTKSAGLIGLWYQMLVVT